MTSRAQMDDFMRCRTFGHQWDEIPAEKAGAFGDPMWVRCLRCTMVRMDEIGGGGKLIKRRYAPPDGYKRAFTTDEGTPSRDGFREMLLLSRMRRARKRSA